MNILQIQDDLKNFSEQQLINEMQRPSGNAPQYLVLSEINRRKRVKADYQANQPMDTQTVAEEAVASAGVPMSGIAGMAEAMAPKSESSLVAPKTPPMPMREGGEVDYYANGGLIEGIAESVSSNADSLKQLQGVALQNAGLLQDMQNTGNPQATAPTPVPVQQPIPAPITPRPITPSFPSFPSRPFPSSPFPFRGQVGIGGKGRPRPNIRNMLGTNMLAGLGSYAGQVQPQAMAEGGVVNAFSGKFFDSSGRPTQELLRAMILQESGGDTKARGSLDEVGLAQIRPSTAIKPGYGVSSLFPELESQIGKGKKYSTVAEAYQDNKELVDKRLEEGSTSKDFMSNYLTGLRKNTDTDAGAISAYNVGLGGLKNIKNPADFKYFTEVSEKMKPVEYDGTPMDSDFMSAEAGTLDGDPRPDYFKGIKKEKEKTDEEPGFFKKYIAGPKLGGLGENILYGMLGDKGKQMVDSYQDQKALSKLIDSETSLDTADDNIEKVSTGDPVDDAASLYAEDLEEKENARTKAEEAEKNKPLTLDEQLASMQEDLKKSREQDKWLAIAQAGLSIMASDKPTLGGAIGEGAGAGLQAYRDAQERYNEGVIDVLNARAKLAKSKASGFGVDDALNRVIGLSNTIAKLEEQRTKLVEFPSADNKKRIEAIDQELRQARQLRDKIQKTYTGIAPIQISKSELNASLGKG